MSAAAVAGLGARLHAGDEGALEDCYRSYGPALRSYLRRMLPSADVDDVVQLAFLDLWRSRQRFDPSRPVQPWLFTIARRRALSHLRSVPLVVDVGAVRDLAGDDGDSQAERLAWTAEVRRAVGGLSQEQQEAIRLVFYGQLSHREAAEYLDLPLGTVKARIWRGLRVLGRRLERSFE